jgi:hypothetical protein
MPFTSLTRLLLATYLDQSNYHLANQQQQEMFRLGCAIHQLQETTNSNPPWTNQTTNLANQQQQQMLLGFAMPFTRASGDY